MPSHPPVQIFPLQSSASQFKTPDEGILVSESSRSPREKFVTVFDLQLDPDGGPSKERAYIRLPPPYSPYILRVVLDAGTPASKNAVLKTNFPLDGGKFARDKFVTKPLPNNFSKPIHINLPISHPGAFVYWVEYDGPSSKRIIGREGYINVDPILRVKSRSHILSSSAKPLPTPHGGRILESELTIPLDGLVILTVVSKWMGPIHEWTQHFQEASQRGYNMLHYTPLQQRGSSGSPYSIADQLAFDRQLISGSIEGNVTLHVKEALRLARDDYGLLSMTDIVLNHTAHNSPWLLEHPEAGFSPFNTPHLAPALELDNAIIDFSSNLASNGFPTSVSSQTDLDTLLGALASKFKELQLWQYYVLDRAREKKGVLAIPIQDIPTWAGPEVKDRSMTELASIMRSTGKILDLGQFKGRYGVHVDTKVAASIVRAAFPELKDSNSLADAWERLVDVINVPLYEEWQLDNETALENIKNRVAYTRMDEHGPKLGEITAEHPLVETYFTRLSHNEQTRKHDPNSLFLANNGWMWNADPLENFALLPSKAYIRREVIVWDDCVKLRYGSGPADNPWLWEYMTHYVTSLAAIFDGFRIDNCHSTPLHVGVTLLDAARTVKPDLYVCAELFTGNEEMDKHFVSRLGLNSLIREAYNGYDPKEFSRLLHRFGVSKPIGSMDTACLTSPEYLTPPTGSGPVYPCLVTPLQGSSPHALLFDLTHDNESPLHTRSAEDALATGALVAFSGSAIGSNKGFDDLYPKLLDIVGDNRLYEVAKKGEENGIGIIKRVLNHLHAEMVLEGFSEGHVHQENDYIALHRIHPQTGKGYLLIAHTAFKKGSQDRGWFNPTKLSRTTAQFILGYTINIPSYELQTDKSFIRGLPSQLMETGAVIPTEGSDENGPFLEIHIPEFFPPGSILLFETQLQGVEMHLDEFCKQGADEALMALDLVDLNVILHRADGEERDATNGEIGTYNVPGYGNLVYSGLEGWMALLRPIMRYNDLGHALCDHLRRGSWALDYIHDRLRKQTDTFPNLIYPAKWFKERVDLIKSSVPSFLRPKYFAIVVYEAYKAARRTVIQQQTEFVYSGHNFTQDLALGSVQMYGLVQTASLDPAEAVPSLAAGLPHFTSGWARCWGRDVFIALRGLFLTTGNFLAAKRHILAFASTLRHGLIPNLLDSARNPRYNSRDSPWWMLQCVQDYVQLAPNGLSILSESVKRRFPKDDTYVPWDDPRSYAYSSTIIEIIQEIMQRHADGISFREHNAGLNLDMQMRDEGFNIEVHVDWRTGLLFGGNRYNCGTWMDKMGESLKAGTKGIPGTPRDGAPIEITGLVKSTLRWLDELSSKGEIVHKGVQATVNGQRRLVMYKEWNDLIQSAFERHYYVPVDPADDVKYVINPSMVNRRGIYKDVFGSEPDHEWSDYQLRPNFPIAMTVAPELFDPSHAHEALTIADNVLRGPLGMKTLDPSDLQYRGDYDNSNDSFDGSIAKGLNYHNGPEWGWPLGYFLRAYLHFDIQSGIGKVDPTATLHHLHTLLLGLRNHIQNDSWRGLPELTNSNGSYCHDSCATQAWSSSTILDFLHDVHSISRSA